MWHLGREWRGQLMESANEMCGTSMHVDIKKIRVPWQIFDSKAAPSGLRIIWGSYMKTGTSDQQAWSF